LIVNTKVPAEKVGGGKNDRGGLMRRPIRSFVLLRQRWGLEEMSGSGDKVENVIWDWGGFERFLRVESR